ncbi:hypothetical protein [Streptomyces sp. 35G-GA-8]|uniref:hypothetical protein n=1 Tax=Streptomyces sp. 35G-GA-8 TaxID=2939434 RepID=UPI00201F6A0F|nr:hypothetical protein [Streptomyces sp. 35G-GA-8]MCL7381397.1 hypothetical protein [Streptomyces sp. 35G-GA-8]
MTALRDVVDCSDQHRGSIARRAYQAPTSFSNHLNGRRVPNPELVTSLHQVAAQDAEEAGRELPHTLKSLLEMRLAALVKHCECCPASGTVEEQTAGPKLSSRAERPAPPLVQPPVRAAQSVLRDDAGRSGTQGTPVQTTAPVPLPEGDRHHTIAADENWSELSILTGYLSEGRDRDAFVMLWSAATRLPARDVPKVVIACRSAGLNDEADAVLTNVGRRDAQAVINIASAFHERRLYEDAGLVLASAARTRTD